MIFYFSGQIPLNRKEGAEDQDIDFMSKITGGTYDRLICPIYEKDGNTIINNLQEKGYVKNQQKRTGRRS